MTAVEEPPLDRKLVAILAADVEGYSRLMHEDEEGALTTLTHHRGILDKLIVEGRGQICGTAGDSVLAEFASVVDAVRSAVEIQKALLEANDRLHDSKRMIFRIGINVGDVMMKDGSIFGDGVNVAARLESIAVPGGICVTRGVRDHLRDKSNYEFEDLGEHSVKNIARPVRVFRLIFDSDEIEGFSRRARTNAQESPDAPLEFNSANNDAAELLFWQSIQNSGSPEEYRAYLSKFPEGIFCELAKSRLDHPDKLDHKSVADAVDTVELAFWNSVEQSADAAVYESYLEKYPEGNFRPLAEIWLSTHG